MRDLVETRPITGRFSTWQVSSRQKYALTKDSHAAVKWGTVGAVRHFRHFIQHIAVAGGATGPLAASMREKGGIRDRAWQAWHTCPPERAR
jgi:hypothetical protein